MMRLNFKNNDKYLDLIVRHHKILINPNKRDYWIINRVINHYINTVNDSDYASEKGATTILKIDEEAASKHDVFYKVTTNFDIEDDLKLGVKSYCYQYVMKMIEKELCSDEVLQLKSMLSYIASLLSDDKLLIEAVEMTPKILVKLLKMKLLKEEIESNSNDLSYDEYICLQLDIIESICQVDKRNFIYIDIPEITSRILKRIIQGKAYYIICTYKISDKNIIDDDSIYIEGNDLEDEEKLYERMMSMTNFLEIKEYIKHIKTEYLIKFH